MTEKQPRAKIKKILKICKILFILWIIYLIGIPLYYTPYELQPSYWEFRKMCELNELPNSEEKYNKILSYFDKKLGDRDDFPHSKEYSRRMETLTLYVFYHQYFQEQDETSLEGKIALSTMASQTPKEKYMLSYDSIKSMFLSLSWHTNRYYLTGNEGSGFHWYEETLACSDIM